jgi:hypothetical protein
MGQQSRGKRKRNALDDDSTNEENPPTPMRGKYKLDRFAKFAFLPLSFRPPTLFFARLFFSSPDHSTVLQHETNKNDTDDLVEKEDSSQGT